MRDIIWTIIILWLIWKVYDAFKSISKPRTEKQQSQYNNQSHQRREGDVIIDNGNQKPKTHIKPSHGEYVDFEEIK